MAEPSTHTPAPRPLLTLDDLTADLLWPKLLRGPVIALGPGRLIVALLTIILAGALFQSGLSADAGIKRTPTPDRWSEVRQHIAPTDPFSTLAPVNRATVLWRWSVRLPAQLVRHFPLTTLLFGPLAALALIVGAGAVSRMAACEFAQGVSLPWPRGIAFALSRLKSLVGALILPILLAWLIAIGIAIAGLLLAVPVLNILTALLFGLLLLAGFAAVMLLIIYTLGKSLLIPAIACDGVDALDAIQRAFAYVIGRPLRLILYLAIAAITVAVSVWIALWLANLANGFTFEAARAWTTHRAQTSLWDAAAHSIGGVPLSPMERENEGLTGTFAASSWLIRLWMDIPYLLALAFALSAASCTATILYLTLRRANDGQDISEIWMPGMVEGTSAPATAPAPASSATPPITNGA